MQRPVVRHVRLQPLRNLSTPLLPCRAACGHEATASAPRIAIHSRMSLVVVEGSLMRRIRILTVACSVSISLSSPSRPTRSAGDFADDPCTDVSDTTTAARARPSVALRAGHQAQGAVAGLHEHDRFVRLPAAGLSLSSEGNIRGTPTAGGSYPFYITVSWSNTAPCKSRNRLPTGSSRSTSTAPGPRLIVVTSGLPDANIGQAYTAPALTASGGTVNSWTLAGGTLPAGLTLASNGVISGHADAERSVHLHRPGERLAEQRHEAALDLRRSPRSSCRRSPVRSPRRRG